MHKLDSSDTTLWSRQFGTPGEESAGGLGVNSAGRVYITGATSGSLLGSSHGGWDAFIRAYRGDGVSFWSRQFGTDRDDYSDAVSSLSGAAIFVSGSTEGALAGANRGRLKAYLRRLDGDGSVVWTHQ